MIINCDKCQTNLRLKQDHVMKAYIKVSCLKCNNIIIAFPFLSGHINNVSHLSLISAIQIINKQGKEKQYIAASIVLEEIIQKINLKELNLKQAVIVFEFLFKIIKYSNTQKNIKSTYDFYFKCLDCFLEKKISETKLHYFNNELLLINRDNSLGYIEQITDEKRLQFFSKKLLEHNDSNRALTYFFITVSNLNMLNMKFDEILNKSYFIEFLKICLQYIIPYKKYLNKILKDVSNNEIFFSQLIVFILDNFKKDITYQKHLIYCIKNIMQLKSDSWALAVRKSIAESGHSNILFQEFLILLNESKSSTIFFWNYYDSVFSNIEIYWKNYFIKAVYIFIKSNSNVIYQNYIIFYIQSKINNNKDITLKQLTQLIESNDIDIFNNDPKTVINNSYKIIDQFYNEEKNVKPTIINKFFKKIGGKNGK